MTDIPRDDIDSLIQSIKNSKRYQSFRERELCDKIFREREAIELIKDIYKKRGSYTPEKWNEIMDWADPFDPVMGSPNNRWFGKLWGVENKEKFLRFSNEEKRYEWVRVLLSGSDSGEALQKVLTTNLRISFGGSGLASLFLYLNDPKNNFVWFKTHQSAAYKLMLVENYKIDKGGNYKEQYIQFVKGVKEFIKREYCHFRPQEIDYIFYLVDSFFYIRGDRIEFNEKILDYPEFHHKPIKICPELQKDLSDNEIILKSYQSNREDKLNDTFNIEHNPNFKVSYRYGEDNLKDSDYDKKDIIKDDKKNYKKNQIKNWKNPVLIDGSNVVHRDGNVDITNIVKVHNYLKGYYFLEENINYIVDANFPYVVGEKKFDELKMNINRITKPTQREKADNIIWKRFFDNLKQLELPTVIISNDRFRDYFELHPAVPNYTHWVKGVTWIQTPNGYDPIIDLIDLKLTT
jgi:hypothetical protein